ncbi:DNA circularization N-terminal domain-containing protein [Pseudomonas solani]|uniref:DNA circularization N-terminal domain-containing protein n=1 Tax=Pseudomonas solani TaxID=2731552 RepID=A0AAU7Y502_9PSED
MTWRDDYRPGSFRGVPFNLKRSSRSGGRRTVLNEYPLRDDASTEDIGRSARRFSLEMVLLGPDYMARRDRLISALEAAGPGTLVHPFYGELLVSVLDNYSCDESTEQGGRAAISVTFVETSTKPSPTDAQVPGALVNDAADVAQADAVAEFEDSFNVADYAGFVAEGAIDALSSATTSITEAGGLLAGAGRFSTLAGRLTGNLQGLILAPGNLATSILGMVRGLSATSDPWAAFRAQASLFNLGKSAKSVRPSGYVTPSRAQQAANQEAVYTLIERVAVTEAARLATGRPLDEAGKPFDGLTFTSRDQAAEVRDQVLVELDRQQLAAAQDRVRPLAAIATQVARDMNQRSASLAPLATYQPLTTQPALLIAHRLYGDARRAEEIVARNSIAHPGFVPGGVALEVLKDV